MSFDVDLIARLLGKNPPLEGFSPSQTVKGRRILVTGAGGFIGSELCREIAEKNPAVLVLVDHTEFSLYEVHRSIPSAIPVLGNYGDGQQMVKLLEEFDIDMVFHVGAYKHVPMCERNIVPAIKNNVLGAETLFKSCSWAEVKDLIVVSSDKAVRPTNVMGATKRLVEYLALCRKEMKVKVVRFGNVLWSTGSVLPLFYEQLGQGKAVTITHKDVDRFFMSVQQAVGLILQSVALYRGIYCFDMGEPVNIEHLARRLAEEMKMSIEVKYVGLRPGEKLHEELTLGEGLNSTQHPQIWSANELELSYEQVQRWIEKFQSAVDCQDVQRIRNLLAKVVPGYVPAKIVDDIWLSTLDDCFQTPQPCEPT